MPARRLSTALAAAVLAGVSALIPAASAHANTGGPGPCLENCTAGGSLFGNLLGTFGGITLTSTAPVHPGAGSLAVANPVPPPPCWYQPGFTPAQVQSWLATFMSDPLLVGPLKRMAQRLLANVIADPETGQSGLWYHWQCTDPNSAAAAAWIAQHLQVFVWVPPAGAAAPGAATLMTPDQLALYAVDSVVLPNTTFERNPAGNSTVNVPTWMWLPNTFAAVSVTATAGPVTVTATAHPTQLNLPTTLPDATLIPASGVCTSLFDAYAGDAAAQPACGIDFGKASVEQGAAGYPVTVRLVWSAAWTSNLGTAGALAPGSITGTVHVPVQELQSIITN